MQLHAATITLAKLAKPGGGFMGKVIDVRGIANEQISSWSGLTRLLPVLLSDRLKGDLFLVE
jgi:hypothetical protein